MASEQFRVVKIDMDTPFTLGDDEQVIDKRADYDDKAWLLLVVKGHKTAEPATEKNATFGDPRTGIPLDDARRLASALSKAAEAFATALGEPVKLSPEMC